MINIHLKKYLHSYLLLILCLNINISYASCCNKIPARVNTDKQNTKFKNMSFIPEGTFMMGGDNQQAKNDEYPKHKVQLDAFWIDQTPVTNAQFIKFIQASNYITTAEKPVDWDELKKQLPDNTPKPSKEDLMPASLVFVKQNHPVPLHNPLLWWAWVQGTNWKHPHGPESEIDGLDHPVVHVSWDDAAAYCKYYNKRLPTEAEWEFAARGGLIDQIYPWGNDSIDNSKANIWQGKFPYYSERTESIYTTPVASYQPNGYGLYDMSGNVWEWVADWYDYQYYTEIENGATNPKGPLKSNDPSEPLAPKKVIRGGSFLCSESYCTGYRVSARMRTSTDTSMEHLGFRCAAND